LLIRNDSVWVRQREGREREMEGREGREREGGVGERGEREKEKGEKGERERGGWEGGGYTTLHRTRVIGGVCK
jgi:hypothetical protein